jgi:uncharacterized protein YukE
MRIPLLLSFAACFLFSSLALSQTQPQPTPSALIENISNQITQIAKSVENLNLRMKVFSDTFTSNQGLRLSEKQQQLLFAFELLNRAESSLTNLQKLKIDLSEKQISINTKLSKNEADSRIESIDRTIGGTTNAEAVRENRRQSLSKERNDLNNLLDDIRNRLSKNSSDIRQTEMFINNIRDRVFNGAEKELKDF